MKLDLFIVFVLVLLFAIAASSASAATNDPDSNALAQRCGTPGGAACTPTPPPPRDLDGDGVPDVSDGCPTVPGPASNRGCPETEPVTPVNNDRDGDGTPDDVDRCPDAGGHAGNAGCPLENEAPPTGDTTIVPALVLPTLPTSGACMLATLTADRVNVRGEPSLDAEIVAMLDPTLIYPATAMMETGDSSNWIRVSQGWVADWVVRKGGECDSLPSIELIGGNDSIWIDLQSQFGRGIDIARVDGQPSSPEEEISCSNNLHIAGRRSVDPNDPSATGFVVNWNINGPIIGTLIGQAIGDTANDSSEDTASTPKAPGSSDEVAASPEPHPGSIQPCIKLDPNSQGFIIDWTAQPEGDLPGGVATPHPDAQGFIIHWYMGQTYGDGSVVPTESMVIAIIQPPPVGDQLPVMIAWVAPAEPDAPEGIIIDYFIGVDPDTGGILIEWIPSPGVQPGPPDSSANVGQQPGPPTLPAVQSILINWTDSQPGPPTTQGFAVHWLPQGKGGGANELILDDTAGSEENRQFQIQFTMQ